MCNKRQKQQHSNAKENSFKCKLHHIYSKQIPFKLIVTWKLTTTYMRKQRFTFICTNIILIIKKIKLKNQCLLDVSSKYTNIFLLCRDNCYFHSYTLFEIKIRFLKQNTNYSLKNSKKHATVNAFSPSSSTIRGKN